MEQMHPLCRLLTSRMKQRVEDEGEEAGEDLCQHLQEREETRIYLREYDMQEG